MCIVEPCEVAGITAAILARLLFFIAKIAKVRPSLFKRIFIMHTHKQEQKKPKNGTLKLFSNARELENREKLKKMHVRAVFARGIRGSDPILFDKKPQIAFVGRSNVGKSSTINAILGDKIARTSSTPGKTQEINFFEVEGKGYFVDLPGYGYAKMPEKEKEKIRKHILWYLASGEAKPKLLVLILDARVGVTAYDRDLIHVAHKEKHSLLLLLNKIDKLTKNERTKALGVLAQEFPDAECITFSATKKDNLSLVRARLFALLGI